MRRTAEEIDQELCEDGLIRRYRVDDGLEGEEQPFVACTFWLAECLIRQGRVERGRELFERAEAAGSELGLFAEQFDPKTGEPCGNFPLTLSHYSHITAALALAEHEAAAPRESLYG
jgi:GH15 family glucan-1,4-alpha-glucosidase